MSNTLLPCPFCGGEAKLVVAKSVGIPGGENGFMATVHCLSSATVGCFSKMSHWALKKQWAAEGVSKAWNRRTQPENEPLTTSELRQMDGEPVYVVTLDNPLENQPYWAIAGINSNDSRYQNGVALYNRVQDDWGAFDLYGDTWLAYRRKPERSEG